MPKTQIVQDGRIYNVDVEHGTVTPADQPSLFDEAIGLALEVAVKPLEVIGGVIEGGLNTVLRLKK